MLVFFSALKCFVAFFGIFVKPAWTKTFTHCFNPSDPLILRIKRGVCEIRKNEGFNSILKFLFFRGHSVQSVQNSVASKQNWPATHVVWHVNSSCCLMWWASQISLPGFQELRFSIIRIPVYEWEGCPWRLLPAETFCTCVWLWGIKWPIALPPSWLCLIYFLISVSSISN